MKMTVGVVGLGLIGASFAKAYKSDDEAVVGAHRDAHRHDPNPTTPTVIFILNTLPFRTDKKDADIHQRQVITECFLLLQLLPLLLRTVRV